MHNKYFKTKTELHWVYQSILNWKNLSTNRTELTKIANLGLNTFYFLHGKLEFDNVHAYFGFYQEVLYLHFIPSSVDTKKSFIDKTSLPSELYSCVATRENTFKGPIEKSEAEKRIKAWEDEKLRDQVLSTMPFFQVFWIPNEDFKANTPLQVNLAIHDNQVDLVLTQMNNNAQFLDTCKPIPPFKPAFKQEQFALLEQLKHWQI